MSDRMTTPLVQSALEMGLFRRDVTRGQLTHHADHGSQYTSLAFSQRLADAGIAASMGSVGDAYDNAMIESFWGTIKTELLYRHVWPTRHDARWRSSSGSRAGTTANGCTPRSATSALSSTSSSTTNRTTNRPSRPRRPTKTVSGPPGEPQTRR
jgi:transposase InsO family protein